MTRPNIQIPKEFAINGEKSDFTQEKIQTGFDKLNPDIFAGDNINKFIDDTYKGLNGVLDLYNGVVLHEMTTTYDDKAVVGKFIENSFKLYRSLVNDNTGHEVTETEYWEEVALGGGSSLPIGSTVVLDKVLSFEESQGLALQGTYVYKTALAGERYGYPYFYNTYVGFKNNATATQTTLGNSTITIYNNANGLKFYNIADKGVIDTFFNSTGVADFYGIDEANERIFLPRNNKFWQFTTNTGEVNNYVEAGLPTHTHTRGTMNITGSFETSDRSHAVTGAFTTSTGATARGDGNGGTGNWINLDASRSWTGETSAPNNAIYGKSDTVQPASSKKLLYYVVGNTVSDTSWIDVVTQVQGGVKDLEDKTQEGIERLKASSNALTTTQITNCITEIPQDIKLELNNGVLTLKAGSKVYDGNGLFAEIPQDMQNITGSVDAQVTVIVCRTIDGGYSLNTAWMGQSAEQLPTSTATFQVWYNITDKKCYFDAPQGWVECSFPLALATSTMTNWASIDQTFNGFGYIGSTVFVTKGVKGLIPNGRNEDGSLKNIEFTTTKVHANTIDVNWASQDWMLYGDKDFIAWYPFQHEQISFNKEKNVWEDKRETTGIGLFTYVGKTYSTDGKITSFTPKLPFRAVDYNDLKPLQENVSTLSKAYITETYVNGTSWYRVWSDGWCEQGGFINIDSASSYTIVTFLKPFATQPTRAVYNAAKPSGAYPNYHNLLFVCDSFTSTTMSVFTKNTSNLLQTQQGFWYACGYIK